MTEISAKIIYKEGDKVWTRGIETWISHTEFGDYLYRNADRIYNVGQLTIKEGENE